MLAIERVVIRLHELARVAQASDLSRFSPPVHLAALMKSEKHAHVFGSPKFLEAIATPVAEFFRLQSWYGQSREVTR